MERLRRVGFVGVRRVEEALGGVVARKPEKGVKASQRD